MKRVGLLTVLLVLTAVTAPAQSPVRITGIYSDMHYIPQAGDVFGTEVFIVANGDGYSAVVQIAQGAPGLPQVVPLTVNNLDVSFSLTEIRFVGKVTRTALVGTLGYDKVSLRRGK